MYEQAGHVAVITLNHPDALNSFNQETQLELVDSTARARGYDSVRLAARTDVRLAESRPHRRPRNSRQIYRSWIRPAES
jgi:1,4-dihydroxy-2-naphthoyl-CoA synthase